MENIKIKTYKAEALTPSKGLRYSQDENGKRVLTGVGTCKDERIVVPNGVQIVGAKAFAAARRKKSCCRTPSKKSRMALLKTA
jgi:hypothetical protein